MQLRERHWRIFSLSGTLETVRGRGIIGKVRGHSSVHSIVFTFRVHYIRINSPLFWDCALFRDFCRLKSVCLDRDNGTFNSSNTDAVEK